MLVAAALVPDTVLLLPGAAGRGPDDAALVALRPAAAAAVARATAGAGRVVVVAPGAATRSVVGPARAGAGAAGVPDHLLAAPVPTVHLAPAPGGPPGAGPGPAPGAVVGLRLALDAGTGPTPGDEQVAERRDALANVHVVEVAPDGHDLRALGRALADGASTALVVVGSGSVRHGPDAPLPEDPRAPGVDAGLLAALRAGGRPARDALAALDPALADALAVSGHAPWQVLVGALDALPAGPGRVEVLHAEVWRGASHAAAVWQVAP